ncbi:MAG: putative ATPase/DNA-binding winged helix-turn-helix (wHTH) protein, partial [Myxococcota bacterium]
MPVSNESLLILGPARIDLERAHVVRDSERRSLTSMETALLRYLAARPGEPVSRETLLEEVWSYKPGTVTRAVDFTVHRLRRKIEVDPSDPAFLQTIHGEGYRLLMPSGPAPSTSNLPPQADRFFGRAELRAQLQQALAAGTRLLTLHGPGGAGKTRLALQIGADVAEQFSGGVWLVELASTRSAEAITYAIASALSVTLTGTTLTEQRAELGQQLRSRGPTLLLLDNFEQVVAPGGPVISDLLASAPALSIVVTSQQRLGLPGEQALSVEALDCAASIALFADRAASACPGFALTASERRTVAEIVTRLDGLPLAIELAAGRAAILSPAEIRQRLPSRFALLQGPRGGLESVIAGSWSLLSGWEQEALAQLSVFRGGFTMAAAEAVLVLDDGPATLDAVQALVDKALLRRRRPRRLALGESIRLFAAARLAEQGGRDAVRARHRSHYLGRWRLSDRAIPPTEREALAADLDNLVAIWRRELPTDPAAAVAALQALRPLFLARGPSAALLALLDQAIDAAPVARLRAEALHARAEVRLLLGQLQGALDDLDAALEALDGQPGDALRGAVLTERALALDRLGRSSEAERGYHEALAVLEASGSRAGAARAEGYLGTCRFNQGDLDGA